MQPKEAMLGGVGSGPKKTDFSASFSPPLLLNIHYNMEEDK